MMAWSLLGRDFMRLLHNGLLLSINGPIIQARRDTPVSKPPLHLGWILYQNGPPPSNIVFLRYCELGCCLPDSVFLSGPWTLIVFLYAQIRLRDNPALNQGPSFLLELNDCHEGGAKEYSNFVRTRLVKENPAFRENKRKFLFAMLDFKMVMWAIKDGMNNF